MPRGSSTKNTNSQIKKGNLPEQLYGDGKPVPPHQIYPDRAGNESVRKPRNITGQNRTGLGNPWK